MTKLKLILGFGALLLSILTFGQQLPISFSADNLSLESVIEKVEKENGYLFTYSQVEVQDILISDQFNENSIEDFLTRLLAKTNLEFEVVDKKFVLLSSKPTNDEVQGSSILLSLLCGSIMDSLTQEPLIGATAHIVNTNNGMAADLKGKFRLRVALNPSDQISISYVGYKSKVFPANYFFDAGCPAVTLTTDELMISEVYVTEYLTDGIELEEQGAVTVIKPNKISALPGQAEPDVLNTIKFLPGISSPDGSASNLCIRGGTADQTLILWEDIPIYHSAHYFGMISAFNPYIMNSVKVYRGGFDASFGGRISGLIDLKSEENLNRANKFGAGVNFINAYANGQVNFLNNKASVIYSVRHSLADIWRSPTFESITRRIHQGVLLQLTRPGKIPNNLTITEDFKFLDTNVKATFRPTERDEITAAWFYGNNDFEATIDDQISKRLQIDSLFLKNSGSKLGWSHHWNRKFTSSISLLSSNYEYDYNYEVKDKTQSGKRKSGVKKSQISEQQIHLKNRLELSNDNQLTFGYQFTQFNVGHTILKDTDNNPQSNINRDIISNLQVGYATLNVPISASFGLETGLRYSYFENESQGYWEPRLRIWHKSSNNLNLYFNAGRYHQFLSQLIQIQGDDSSIETPVWVLAGRRDVPVLTAHQIQLGAIFAQNGWTFDIQTYYKNIDGLTSLSTGFDDNLEGEYKLGTADIGGLDILIKKRWNNYRSWISYSFSKVAYHFDKFFDPDFPAAIEQPHSFHWVNLWKKNAWEFSIGWKATSGTPYSLIDNFRVLINPQGQGPGETIDPIVNSFNSERLPFQHQMDASILYTLKPNLRRKWKAVFGFSVYNIYNQINQYQRSFLIDQQQNEPVELVYTNRTDLGFTPNVVARIEF